MQRQIDDLQGFARKQAIEMKEARAIIEVEKASKERAIKEVEEEHKKRYEQLRELVEQYKTQMSEFVNITQKNQELLGSIKSVPPEMFENKPQVEQA